MDDNIFINYRHGEASDMFAGLIYAKLLERFDEDQIFKDLSNLELGEDYVKKINKAISSSKVFLVLITSTWGKEVDENGDLRIFAENDFVRMEIAAALERKCPIIPILHSDTKMPKPTGMPSELRPITRLHAVSINPQRLDFDMEKLYTAIEKKLKPKKKQNKEEEDQQEASGSSGVGVIVLIVILVIIYFIIKGTTNIF